MEGRHPCPREGPVPWSRSVCVGVLACVSTCPTDTGSSRPDTPGGSSPQELLCTDSPMWSVERMARATPDASATAGECQSAPCAPGSCSRSCSKCGPVLWPDGAAGWGRASTGGPGKKALPLPWLPVVRSEYEYTWSVVNRVQRSGHEQTSPAGEVKPPLACPGLVPPPDPDSGALMCERKGPE